MCLHRLGRLILLLSGIVAATSPATDWPRFLGPNGDGTSPETRLLDRWPASGPPVLWSKTVGTGYSAPSVIGDRLVLHHRIGGEEIVECLEAGTGNPLWRHADPTTFEDPYGYNNGPRCTPVLTTNRCYTFGAEGRLLCLDLATGRKIWERDTARDWKVPEAFFGVGSTPLLDGDRLFVMVGGQPNSGVIAIDAATGKTLWENVGERTWQGKAKLGWPGEPPVDWFREDKQASYASPVLATIQGKRHLLCLMRQGLVSLDPQTGEVNFTRWFRATVPESVNAANPVVVDDLVLISAAYYRVGSVLLRVHPDGRGFDEVWKGVALEAHWSTPVYHDGFLYGFSGRNEPDARLRCVELKTGRLAWDRDESWRPRTTATPLVFGRGSMILADGELIALGEGGLLGRFKPDPKAPVEMARFQVPGLEYPSWTAPVLSTGRLFLRSGRHEQCQLVCLNLRENEGR